MIKKFVVLAVLAAVLRMTGLLPFQSSDVSELVPVQALVVSVEDGRVYLDGGGCLGVGENWEEALQDLDQSAEGHVFLGTADHVVLCGEAVSLLYRISRSDVLRPAASVCVCPYGVVDAKTAGAYLDAHHSGVTLRQVRALQLRPGELELPELIQTRGGLRLDGAHR